MQVVLLPTYSFTTIHAPEVQVDSTWANHLQGCLVVLTIEKLQMTVMTRLQLLNWLKNFAPVFQLMRSKTKTNRILCERFFLHFGQVTGNCYRNSDWFIALFGPVVPDLSE